MKKNHSLIDVQTGLFTSIILLALTMNFTACQVDDLNADEEIAHATYTRVKEIRLNREYTEAFTEEFGTPDPTHDWSYKPLTVIHSGGNGEAQPMTRAVTVPTIQRNVEPSLTMPYSEVKELINAIPEKGYNYERMNTNIGYYAEQETKYDIYPVMWGQKFCDTNKVGLFTFRLDANGTPDINTIKDYGMIWSDNENGHTNVFMEYGDDKLGYRKDEFPVGVNNIDKQNSRDYGETGQTLMDFTVEDGYKWQGNKRVPKYKTVSVEPQNIIFPHYEVTIPANTYWGIYLETKKDQNTSERVKWYSVANFNYKNTEPAGNINLGGNTYLCFEDAPVKGAMDGQRVDGFQGYDKDYNDICLLITPRPIESSFSVDEVRVMCEDLGGTFDWDFNDIVYDIKITQHLYNDKNATATITLQSVGGTLPIYINYPNQKDYGEIHTMLGQKADEDGLFEPVLTGQAKILYNIDLGAKDVDAAAKLKEIAKNIQITVADPRDDSRHVVNFPNEEGDKNPQCFMCQAGTHWSDELVNIKETYPAFAQWVASQTSATDWWNVEKYTNKQQEVVIK